METGIKVFAVALIAVVVGAVIGILTGLPVMWLWNYVMPDVFGVKEITFWQAWALAALASILFKPASGGSK